ncbi:Glycosyl transferase, group 1 [Bradyrhizobium sp. STM 3843]|uniref:glycosyltransferase n=1 Tax=Bradyrhizobium sp. STM 3843 TaxID=551947 RepID=UPI00024037F9|nr:glycosyltransferase [Bradyrhizobium sp. STM 3843]CCE09036.1 Glycosyl transferase, group 1 [Bradyrhizobium sp. STM 3843]
MDHGAFKQSASGADVGRRPRIAFLDILKPREISFLRDIIASLAPDYDIRFVHSRQEGELIEAIAWADVVWLEWCLEHAVWATNRIDMRAHGKKVIVRLHSTEVIDGRFPHQVKWEAVDHLIFVSEDIRDELLNQMPDLPKRVMQSVISNGIDCDRFLPGAEAGDPYRIAWVGDVAMKKNPMLALQILRRLVDVDPRYHLHVAGEVNCARTARYLDHLIGAMDLGRSVSFYGRIADIESWYRDKGVLLSTTLYESFGMNIGEAMASGCWPVVHNYPGAAKTWPAETLFASVDQAVARILKAQPNAYRSFVLDRYSLSRQEQAVRRLLSSLNGAAAFDAQAYWEQRHASLQGSIRSVGHVGLGEAENQQDYATNAEHLCKALLDRFPEPDGKLLLDAGCGIGLVSALCAGLGFDVIGVDFSETAIAQARVRVPQGSFIVGAFDQVSVPPVDVAICMDVFFHILDDELWVRSFRTLAEKLKPGGRLLVLEHFPGKPSDAPHVRWRSLAAYRDAAALLGLTLGAVDTYRLQQIGADKTLLVFDKVLADVESEAPGLAPDDAPDRLDLIVQ